MTSVRRNTYVLDKRQLLQVADITALDRQNLMRLKVNRIAIIQELRVEHIVNQLVKTGVLSSGDLRKIERGTTPPDRTRLFIDLLASKNKDTEWYKHFRNALINPDANPSVCKRYRCLVEFLDNTIIHRPTSQGNLFRDFATRPAHKLPNQNGFSHYNTLPPIQPVAHSINPAAEDRNESPNILKIHAYDSKDIISPRYQEGDCNGEVKKNEGSSIYPSSGSIVKGYIHHWVPLPPGFHSQIKQPDELFRCMGESSLAEDREQLQLETQALDSVRSLELMCHLYRKRKLPDHIELIKCEAVEDILSRPTHCHLLMKYLTQLERDHQLNLLDDLSDSFQLLMTSLQPNDSTDKIGETIKLGLRLTDFLSDLNKSRLAELTLVAILCFLNKHPKLETVMATFHGYVKLMQLMNKEYNFCGANNAYFRATEVLWQIEKMSFGQELVDKGEMYLELNHMLLEGGSINSAYSWAFKALQHVPGDEKATVISVLCNAVMSYCSRWNIKRAEQLAVQAVQLARQYFGSRHPLYLKALLTYCYYSNEFRQDEEGLEIARHTLHVAETTYGIDTPQEAHARRALCKALVVVGNFDKDEYLHHAKTALSIAEKYYPESHPAMYLFHFTMAFALHWSTHHLPVSEQQYGLTLAMIQIRQAASLVKEHFGDLSLRHAQILGLMGQIFTKLEKFKAAESLLETSENMMSICLPAHNNYLLVAQATLAMFYTLEPVGKTTQAKALLQHVVKSLESPGVKVKWVTYVFDHLIALHQSAGEMKDAAIVEAQMEEWLANNPPHSAQITPTVLMEPPKPYADFLADFNIWQKRVDRWKELKSV